VHLLQVAHFYDTIDQEMITSQQPMMLNSALAFERIIKDPKAGMYHYVTFCHLLSASFLLTDSL